MNFKKLFPALLTAVAILGGCGTKQETTTERVETNTLSSAATESVTPTAAPPENQVELVKPASGTGNVQGKVLWNDQPASNIEVTLSEKFSSFLGASGKSFKARTDKTGTYVIKNVPPKEYEGLTARVFDTPMVIFIQSGILQAKKYTVEANKTLFVDPTHLFKSDLKLLYPKASSVIKEAKPTFKWSAYAGASYYKFSLYADDFKANVSTYAQRVDGTSYQSEKSLPKGSYRIEVSAYNANDHKISQSPEQYKFRVGP